MPAIKTIGASGQVALGKKYAGQHVLVDEIKPGFWTIKVGEFIPTDERWLHEPEAKRNLDRALAWAAENPPAETDLDELAERLEQ